MSVYVIDNQGAKYEVDNTLRDRAYQLMKVPKFQPLISHVDLNQVIFLRVSSKKGDWHGKCMYIGKAPQSIIASYVVNELTEKGMIDLANVRGFDSNMFDIRYLILINNDSISMTESPERVEDVTLVHELMHIKRTSDGVEKHDIEDFRDLVQEFGPYWTQGSFKEEYDEDGVVQSSFPQIPDIISDSSENWKPEESN